jgi:DNA-binding transcriptional regulator YhcF (GntR family)
MESIEAGNGDTGFEHEHEVVELGAPFAQVFGPEIVDAKLSDFEFRLLAYLRITAAANGSTWMSHRQMAKYLGKSEKTVKRAYSELMKKGFARSQKRSYAQTSKKILTAPSKIYHAKRMRRFFSYLRADTSEEDIAFLRRDHLDNSEVSIGDINDPNDDLDSPNNSIGDINDPPLGDKNDPSLGTNLGASRSRSSEVDEEEVDQTSNASHRESSSQSELDMFMDDEDPEDDQGSSKMTRGDRYRARFGSNPVVEESKNLPDEARLSALKGAVKAVESEGARRSRQKSAKRRESKRVMDASPDGPRPAERTTAKLKGKGGHNAKDVKQLYYEKTGDFFPDAKVGRWGVKELSHAKALLVDYEWDLVSRVITDLCANWSAYGERMKNDGEFPTIAWIYACRQQLFSEIQKKRADSGEPTQPKRRRKQGERLGG